VLLFIHRFSLPINSDTGCATVQHRCYYSPTCANNNRRINRRRCDRRHTSHRQQRLRSLHRRIARCAYRASAMRPPALLWDVRHQGAMWLSYLPHRHSDDPAFILALSFPLLYLLFLCALSYVLILILYSYVDKNTSNKHHLVSMDMQLCIGNNLA